MTKLKQYQAMKKLIARKEQIQRIQAVLASVDRQSYGLPAWIAHNLIVSTQSK